MRLALALMTCSILMLHQAQAETYTGETSFEEKILKDATFVGPAQLKDVIAESLSVVGPLEFYNLMVEKDTKVEGPVLKSENGKFGSLHIIGPFTAKKVTCTDLKVVGPVDVNHLEVTGYANIVGPLKVKEGYFVYIDVVADEISLENVNVDHILVKQTPGKKQVLQLKGRTLVKGDITFESGQGVIEQGLEAKIQGNIKGATVEKK